MKKIYILFFFIILLFNISACDKKTDLDNENIDNKNIEDENVNNNENIKNNILTNNQGDILIEFENEYYLPIVGVLNSKEDFKMELHKLIEQSHTKHLTYKECWTALETVDEDPNNSNNVLCIYSGLSMPKNNHVGSAGSYGQWNREHLFPQSRGFKNDSAVAHNDIFHLRVTEYTANLGRKDTDFGEGNAYFEPKDDVKGDIARALLYMAVRYNEDDYSSYTYNGKTYTDSDDLDLELVRRQSGTLQQSTGEYVFGNLEYLIKWNYIDPVSDIEKKRNDAVFSIQGNRNPFIDYNEIVAFLYPEYAKEYVDISKISYLL